MNVISIIIGFIFSYVVYQCFNRRGFLLGYVVNFLYAGIEYFLQANNQEITIISIATILLAVTIGTVLEYIAYQRAKSFVSYLVQLILIGIGIALIVLLIWAVFTFIANPSILLKT